MGAACSTSSGLSFGTSVATPQRCHSGSSSARVPSSQCIFPSIFIRFMYSVTPAFVSPVGSTDTATICRSLPLGPSRVIVRRMFETISGQTSGQWL